MKFLVALLLTSLLSFIAGLYFPWWSIALVAFAVSLFIPQKIGLNFLSGFLGIFLLWVFLAWRIDVQNHQILSYKIAQLFPLNGSSFLLILVTGLIGGLVGGFAAMSASFLQFKRKEVYSREELS